MEYRDTFILASSDLQLPWSRCNLPGVFQPQHQMGSLLDLTVNGYANVHYGDVIMGAMSSKNHQSHNCLLNRLLRRWIKENIKGSCHWSLCGGIHRWPVNSPLKWPATGNMFPFDGVIMVLAYRYLLDSAILAIQVSKYVDLSIYT